MAIAIPGPLVSAISGNLAGVNFAQTRTGHVIRKRRAPISKHSEPVVDNRAFYQSLLSTWWDYTDEERQAWRSAASLRTFPNRLGIPRLLSGFQLFMKIKILRRVLGAQTFTDPPLMFASLGLTSLTIDFTSGGALRFSCTTNEADVNWFAIAYGSRPMRSTACTHFSFWRQLGGFHAQIAPAIVTTHWNAALGHPQAGEIVAIRCFGWIANQLPSPFFLEQDVVA